MSSDFGSPESPDPVARAAAAWLSRRDRGFTPEEQDAYLQWRQENPRHREAIAWLEKTWGALDALAEWRPVHSARPNPDLLAQSPWRRRSGTWVAATCVGGAMAALVVGFFALPAPRPSTENVTRALRVIPPPERVTFEDGSSADLNRDGRIERAFTQAERRVRLLAGEAHFTVAKNPARPFIVEVDGVAVRAVGTAFNVRRGAQAIEVLVTEGKVHVESAPEPARAPEPTPLVAGERAIVDTTSSRAKPVVVVLSGPEMEHALAWQGARLEFSEMPLSDVVAEFNLRNRQQLMIEDPLVARVRVSGSFRADNVDGFVRLLDASFGVAVERSGTGSLVLRRGR